VRVAEGLWLQNIDSREFAYKFFGFNILGDFVKCWAAGKEKQIPFGDDNKKSNGKNKSKRLRDAQPHPFNSLLLL
jgi:hypothetical protein